MADTTTNLPIARYGDPNEVLPPILRAPLAANLHIFAGAMVGRDASGNMVKASSATCVLVQGIARAEYNNTTGQVNLPNLGGSGAIVGEIIDGPNAILFQDTSITVANIGQDVYVVDDQTVSANDGGGTRLRAGYLFDLDPNTGLPIVMFNVATPAVRGATSQTQTRARAVATSLAAYAGSGTATLTASATGAIGAQDGVTLVAGDVVFLPEGLTNVTAKDAGPWLVVNPGAVGVKYVLTRPSWWANGAAIEPGAVVEVTGEGPLFGGNAFKSFVGKGKVIGTDAPVMWPKNFMKTITLAGGTSVYVIGAGGGGELFMLRSTTLSAVMATQNTHAGTLGTNRIEVPVASRIAGVIGIGAVSINSVNDNGGAAGADTSSVDVLVTNW